VRLTRVGSRALERAGLSGGIVRVDAEWRIGGGVSVALYGLYVESR
jgi:hypothetical protein